MNYTDILNTCGEMLKYTLSFFLGLFLNSMVDHWKDKQTCRTMLAAIAAEVRANQTTLEGSFLKLFREGIVFREFRMEAVSQYLADPDFIKHAPQSVVDDLYAYVRDLKLANTYREKAEGMRLHDGKNKWLEGLIEKWGENLEACGKSIKTVTHLKLG